MPESPVFTRIRDTIEGTPVVAFLNGTPMWPTCTGSAAVAHYLSEMGVAFTAVDVTTDPELRDGVKAFAQLDELPQVFINGALLGGGDIFREMAESGELAEVLREQGIAAGAS